MVTKISLHMGISWLLTHLGTLVFQVAGQAIPSDRFAVNKEIECFGQRTKCN